ncbi:hypothetical protein [Acetobacter sp.]|uniref:hypothetical protein n=1 Tax=Acetobacter sp. TaxID=440 RepID=UPI0039E7C14E
MSKQRLDAEIRMWAMDRALDSFDRKSWEDSFFRACVLTQWASSSKIPKFTSNGGIDVEEWLHPTEEQTTDE